MNATTYTQARQNLKAIFDRATLDSTPTIVKQRNGEDVVILSLRDYQSMDETSYLLSTPANRAHLEEGIQAFEAGEYIEVDLDEL